MRIPRRPIVVTLALVVACVLIIAGAGLALVWEPDRPVETLIARWGQPPSQFIPIDGLSVHLRDEGPRDDPEPIVLLHGTSSSLHTWDSWAADLSRTRRVIRLDLPGFGLTGPAPDNDYRMVRYISFLDAVYRQMHLQRTVLAGNSLGGAIAWQFALDHPAKISRLILIDAAGYPMTSKSIPIGFRLARIPALAGLMRNILPRSIIESSVRSVYGNPDRVTPQLIDRYFELTLRAGNRAAVGERFRQTDWGTNSESIRRITQPTLILWGDKDALIPPEHGERFQREIAGSDYVIFPGLGHVPQEEDPSTSLVPVQKFLARSSGNNELAH